MTIVNARYGGSYEPGVWLAFPIHADQLPQGWDGDDLECMEFWSQHADPIGAGASPQAAYDDLLHTITEHCARITPG